MGVCQGHARHELQDVDPLPTPKARYPASHEATPPHLRARYAVRILLSWFCLPGVYNDRLETFLSTPEGRLSLFQNQEVRLTHRATCRHGWLMCCTNRQVYYHVGSIMCHRRYNYVCVITGWDAEVSSILGDHMLRGIA
jgi:hypothetical protein